MSRLNPSAARIKRQKSAKRWGLVKNISIGALALLLVAQLIYGGVFSIQVGDLTAWLSGDSGQINVQTESELFPAATAVRLSIRTEAGRYSVQYDAEALSEWSASTTDLLEEAVGSLQTPVMISQQTYEAAFRLQGIWLDFAGQVPLYAVVQWNAPLSSLDIHATEISSLLLCHRGDRASLLYRDEATNQCYEAQTAVRPEDLLRVTQRAESNGVYFALEQEGYDALHPETLLPGVAPEPSIYTVSSMLSTSSAVDNLLRALVFPSQSSYSASDGQVYRDGGDTLRLTTGGSVYYQSEDGARYGDLTNQQTALEACRRLVQEALGSGMGAASLQLTSVETLESGEQAYYFCYVLDGAVVSLGETDYAARCVVWEGRLTEYILRPRTFLNTGTTTIMLPITQALAVLNQLTQGQYDTQPQAVLELVYREQSDSSVRADWQAFSPLFS